jgi:hypothetical protein
MDNEYGEHMHTHYVCTFWGSGKPKACGWHGWSVPGWDAPEPNPGKLLLPDLLTYVDDTAEDTLEEEILASMRLPLDPNAALPVGCCGTARSALARATKDEQESAEETK